MSDKPRNRYKLGTVKVSEGTGNDPRRMLICWPSFYPGAAVDLALLASERHIPVPLKCSFL